MGKTKNRNNFFSGVMLLTLAGAAVKICGLLFKIPLVSVIGEEGMGYFSSAYVIYTFFYVLSTSGLPVGLSILVARSPFEKKKYLCAALSAFGALGGALGILMLLFPEIAANTVGNPGAASSIAVMGPTLIFVCLAGAFRGYFQGEREMLPTAVSQMIEAVMKTALGILFAYISVRNGHDTSVASAWALFGICIGSAMSLLYLICSYALKSKKSEIRNFLPRISHYSELFSVVLPVGAASMVMSASSLIDLGMMMHRLQDAGFSPEEANRLYGCYSGIAVPLFNLPPVLVVPVASAVIPFIAAALKEQNAVKARELSEAALRLALLVSLPCAVGLGVLAKPILTMLFGDASAENAAPMLILLAPSVVFVAIQTVTGAVLQGSGSRIIPVLSVLLGSALKLVAGYFLIGRYGMAGAPTGTFLCYLLAAAVNLYFYFKKTGSALSPFKTLLAPMISGAGCGFFAHLSYNMLIKVEFFLKMRGLPAVFFSIILAVIIYLLAIIAFGCLDKEILSLLPGVGKLFEKRTANKNLQEKSGMKIFPSNCGR